MFAGFGRIADGGRGMMVTGRLRTVVPLVTCLIWWTDTLLVYGVAKRARLLVAQIAAF